MGISHVLPDPNAPPPPSRQNRFPKVKTEPWPGRCNVRRADGTYCHFYPAKRPDNSPNISGRCRKHGGLSGFQTLAMTHELFGRGYQRDVPPELAKRLEQALKDPDLAKLHAEMALLDARMGELFSQLPTGENEDAWRQAMSCVAQLKDELGKPKDEVKIEDVQFWLTKLDETFMAAKAERQVWAEVYEVVELRRRLADTERKREEMLETAVTAKHFLLLMAGLQTSIAAVISPENCAQGAEFVRQALAAELRKTFNRPELPTRDTYIEAEAEEIEE